MRSPILRMLCNPVAKVVRTEEIHDPSANAVGVIQRRATESGTRNDPRAIELTALGNPQRLLHRVALDRSSKRFDLDGDPALLPVDCGVEIAVNASVSPNEAARDNVVARGAQNRDNQLLCILRGKPRFSLEAVEHCRCLLDSERAHKRQSVRACVRLCRDVVSDIERQRSPQLKLRPKSRQSAFGQERYRLCLACHYAITRNDIFDRLVVGDRSLPSLDEPLAHAHSLETDKLAAANLGACAGDMWPRVGILHWILTQNFCSLHKFDG